MMKINYNGAIYPTETPILNTKNRNFLYNDGFFETMRVQNGEILWWSEHFERILYSLEVLNLNFDLKNEALKHFLQKEIKKTLESNENNANYLKNARIRLSFFRENGGFYTPISNKAHYIIEAEKLETETYIFDKNGLNIGIAETVKLPFFGAFKNSSIDDKNNTPPAKPLQTIKNTLAPWYVQTNAERKNRNLDEILLENIKKEIIDGGFSAFILIKNGILQIPRTENATIQSVMRNIVLKKAKKAGFRIKTTRIDAEKLAKADEILLLNVIRGIQFVKKCEIKGRFYEYGNIFAKQLFELL